MKKINEYTEVFLCDNERFKRKSQESYELVSELGMNDQKDMLARSEMNEYALCKLCIATSKFKYDLSTFL